MSKDPKDNQESRSSSADSQAGEESVQSVQKAEPEKTTETTSETAKKTTRKAAAEGAPKTAKVLDEIARSTGNKSGTKPARRNKRSGLGIITLVILLLPLLAGIAWLAWQQIQMQQTLVTTTQQNSQLQQTLASQSAEIEALRQRPEPAPAPDNSAELAQLQEALNSELRRLQQQLAAVQNRPGPTATPDFDWKIFEAEYLVNTAAQKLRLERDVASAVSLLEQADAALVAANHAGAFTVREALAVDLAQLRSIEIVDVQGVYLRIESLINNVGQLDLLGSMREDFESRLADNSIPVSESAAAPGWLDSTLEFLGDVFVWREWEERPDAILAPGQETLIKLNLRLLLEQAGLALLQQDTQLFRNSLTQAGEWLRRYAVLDSSTGRAINAELNALLALDINPPLPDLTASLAGIRELAESER